MANQKAEPTLFRISKLTTKFAPGLAGIAVILLVWEIAASTGLINVFFLPPPTILWSTFWELIWVGFPDGILLGTHVITTLRRCLIGYGIAIAMAIPLGILIGYFSRLEVISRSFVAFGRSVAPISILPLFIVWFGIGETSKIAVITFACFWATITNTIAGVRYADPNIIRAAQSMETSQFSIFYEVILPSALPRIFAGMKVSLAVAFMVIVAAEMIATVFGLGTLINEARTWFRTDITIIGMLVIGFLGYIASISLDYIERLLIPWSHLAQEVED